MLGGLTRDHMDIYYIIRVNIIQYIKNVDWNVHIVSRQGTIFFLLWKYYWRNCWRVIFVIWRISIHELLDFQQSSNFQKTWCHLKINKQAQLSNELMHLGLGLTGWLPGSFGFRHDLDLFPIIILFNYLNICLRQTDRQD